MEIFVDFGLFELLAVAGITVLAKAVYRHRTTGFLFLLASIALPAALIVAAEGETARWLAVGALATALVNAAVVFGTLREGRGGEEAPGPHHGSTSRRYSARKRVLSGSSPSTRSR